LKKIQLRVKVTPKSARSEVVGFLADGTLKLKVRAAPERGKANAEVRALLAKQYGVKASAVKIVSGETSPLKRILIE